MRSGPFGTLRGWERETETPSKERPSRDTPTAHKHRLNRVKTQLRNLDIEAEGATLGKDSLYKIWHVEEVGAKKRYLK